MIEAIIVVTMLAILAGIAIPTIGSVQAKMDTRNARDTLILLSARARAAAVERGVVSMLAIDPGQGVASVRVSGETIGEVNFARDFTTTMTTSTGGSLQVCYSPRGFALVSCSSSSLPATVTFRAANESAEARVRPLGGVVKQ